MRSNVRKWNPNSFFSSDRIQNNWWNWTTTFDTRQHCSHAMLAEAAPTGRWLPCWAAQSASGAEWWVYICGETLDTIRSTKKHLCPYNPLHIPKLKTGTSRGSTVDPVADLSLCFALEACQRHHSLKASHPAKFGTKHVCTCSFVPLSG